LDFVIAIKPKAKYRIPAAAVFVLYIQQKKKLHISEDLLPHRISSHDTSAHSGNNSQRHHLVLLMAGNWVVLHSKFYENLSVCSKVTGGRQRWTC
jgi:hypothetical protein